MARTDYTWDTRKTVLLAALGLILILFSGTAGATDLRNIESIQPLPGNQITFQGNISLNSQYWIKGVRDPTSSSDLLTKSFADSAYLNRDGTDTMDGSLDLNENELQNIDGIQDGAGSNTIHFDGSNNVEIPNGNLNLSGNRISDIGGIGSNAPEFTSDGTLDFGIATASFLIRNRHAVGLGMLNYNVISEGGTYYPFIQTRSNNNNDRQYIFSEQGLYIKDLPDHSRSNFSSTGVVELFKFPESTGSNAGNVEIPNGNLDLTDGSSEITINSGNGVPIRIQESGNARGQLDYNFGNDRLALRVVDGGGSVSDVIQMPGESSSQGNVNIPNGNLDVNGQIRSDGNANLPRFQLTDSNQQAGVYDGVNNQWVLQGKEGGNVEIPNGDLKVTGSGDVSVEGSSNGGMLLPKCDTCAAHYISYEENVAPFDGPEIGGYDGIVFYGTNSNQRILTVNDGGSVDIPNGNLDMNGNTITGNPNIGLVAFTGSSGIQGSLGNSNGEAIRIGGPSSDSVIDIQGGHGRVGWTWNAYWNNGDSTWRYIVDNEPSTLIHMGPSWSGGDGIKFFTSSGGTAGNAISYNMIEMTPSGNFNLNGNELQNAQATNGFQVPVGADAWS